MKMRVVSACAAALVAAAAVLGAAPAHAATETSEDAAGDGLGFLFGAKEISDLQNGFVVGRNLTIKYVFHNTGDGYVFARRKHARAGGTDRVLRALCCRMRVCMCVCVRALGRRTMCS